MRVEKRGGYRVVRGGPVPPQADAITLGRTIIVRERAADQAGLMAHELVHVRQFRELGAARFLLRYVGSYLRFRLGGHGHMASYRRIPLEVEASWLSRLYTVAELEPSADRSRRRPKPGRRTRAQASSADPRPVPLGGTWNRSRKPLPAAVTPGLQAAAVPSRSANA